MSFSQILLASDGSPGALTAADWLRRNLARPDTTVTIVTVRLPVNWSVTSIGYAPDLDTMEEEADMQADAALAITEQHLEGGFGRVRRIVRVATPAAGILSAIQQEQPELVVIGHRSLNRLESLLLGSVSAEVVAKSRVPVIVVPAATRTG